MWTAYFWKEHVAHRVLSRGASRRLLQLGEPVLLVSNGLKKTGY